MKYAALAMSVAIGLAVPPAARAQSTFSKTANPTTGVAPLTVVYTYTFDNKQCTHALSSVDTPADDKCSPVTFAGGDANQNQVLDVGESWRWTCTTVLNASTTNTAQTGARFTTCSGATCSVHQVDFITAHATVTLKPLAVSINGRTSACKNDVVTLTAVPTGGNPPYSYSWTTGATSQAIAVDTSTAGTFPFGVTSTDSAGASASASTTVTVAQICLTPVTLDTTKRPEFPLVTTIEWGCGWSLAGRCLSPTITRICVGGHCIDNPRSPAPQLCPRCDVVTGAGGGLLLGFAGAALLLRSRRPRDPR